MNDRDFLIALNSTNRVGYSAYTALVSRFGSLAAAARAKPDEISEIDGVGQKLAQIISQALSGSAASNQRRLAEKDGCSIITILDEAYPARLREIPNAPLVLYVRGKLDEADYCAVGIVGTRKATPYGKSVASGLGQSLADAGITVVSGLASGIDAFAHTGALRSKNGRTIAVVAGGADWIYPPSNKKLYLEISERGAVVAESPMGYVASPPDFARRNRIISGLSAGIVVVEAPITSGALITADFALEQGREVMCVPGPVDSPSSRGCNQLIKTGATLVEDELDVIQAIPEFSRFLQGRLRLPALEQMVLKFAQQPISKEQLSSKSGIGSSVLESVLTSLAKRGAVRIVNGKVTVANGS